jgi:hypothetical protein
MSHSFFKKPSSWICEGLEGLILTAYCVCNQCCGKEDGISVSVKQLSNSNAYKVCAAPSKFPFGITITISGG